MINRMQVQEERVDTSATPAIYLVPSKNGGDGRNITDADIAENVTNLIESQTLVTEDAVLDVPSISDDVQNLDKSSELVEEAAESNAVYSNYVITTDLVTDSENVANSKADPTEDRADRERPAKAIYGYK